MEINLLKEYGINFEAYCAKPTQTETVKILTLLINIILQVDMATCRSLIEICRIVNTLLPRVNSKIKLLYHDLLEPNNGTVTAVKQLHLIVAKLRLACNTNVLSDMNEIQEKLEVLKQKRQEVSELEKILNSNCKMIHLKQVYQANVDQLELEQENLREEDKKLNAIRSTLKQFQDRKESLAVQLKDKTDNSAIRDEIIIKQTNLYQVLSSYDSKKCQLRSKIEVHDQLESMPKAAARNAPEVQEMYINIIKNIDNLIDLTIQSFKIYAKNDELFDEHFSIDKNNRNTKKQIEAQHKSKQFEEQNNVQLMKKLKDMMDLIVSKRDEFDKLQSDAVKLDGRIKAINEKCKEYSAIKTRRTDDVKSFEKECLLAIEKAQEIKNVIQSIINNDI